MDSLSSRVLTNVVATPVLWCFCLFVCFLMGFRFALFRFWLAFLSSVVSRRPLSPPQNYPPIHSNL